MQRILNSKVTVRRCRARSTSAQRRLSNSEVVAFIIENNLKNVSEFWILRSEFLAAANRGQADGLSDIYDFVEVWKTCRNLAHFIAKFLPCYLGHSCILSWTVVLEKPPSNLVVGLFKHSSIPHESIAQTCRQLLSILLVATTPSFIFLIIAFAGVWWLHITPCLWDIAKNCHAPTASFLLPLGCHFQPFTRFPPGHWWYGACPPHGLLLLKNARPSK